MASGEPPLVMEALRTQLREKGEVSFTVRAHPGARQSRFRKILDDGTVKIDLAAPPENGKANAELVAFLAEQFGVDRSDVEILSGTTSRIKTVRISR